MDGMVYERRYSRKINLISFNNLLPGNNKRYFI